MDLTLSASQFKTYQRCKRLWWFDKIAKMPRSGGSYSHVFGKVLHAVVERWLLADASGRNLAGERKELYPDGWQTEEGDTLLSEDEEVIKILVAKAIDEGVIQRLPERVVEKSFTVPLIPGVDVTGRIDLALPGEVHDHKSTISMRYALSPKKLQADTQMLLYAMIQKLDGKSHVTLKHNVFDRTNIKVRKTVVNVPTEDVLEHWQKLKVLAAEMQTLKNAKYEDEDFNAIEKNMPEGCNMYGGCRFIGVCTKREAPSHFRTRYKRLNKECP